MNMIRIRQIFRDFNGSQRWAAELMDVRQSAISQWLTAMKTGSITIPADRLQQLERIAEQIEATNGACIDDVDGKSLRSQINKLRRKYTKKHGGAK